MRTVRFDNDILMGAALANDVSIDLINSINNGRRPLIIFPGGNSPLPFLYSLAQKNLPWEKIFVTTTDERCVPINSPHSNAGQLLQILGELPHLVSLYDESKTISANAIPFPADIAVIGMGFDGHIASLFPSQDILEDSNEIFTVLGDKEPKDRVTLPFNLLTSAKRIILLVCGSAKMTLCEEIFQGNHQNLPVAKLLYKAPDKIELYITP